MNSAAMNVGDREVLLRTRRHFFADCGLSLGSLALAGLVANDTPAATSAVNPLAARPPHFAPRAKHVIYLFMAGGPSQFELFEHKPVLRQRHGEPLPESFLGNRRFAFIPNNAKLLATSRRFARH